MPYIDPAFGPSNAAQQFAVDDGFSVYQELANTLPSEKFAIAGESAGGNLALTLLLKAKDKSVPLPDAAALLLPWCDLTRIEHQQIDTPSDPTLHPEDLDRYAEAYVGRVVKSESFKNCDSTCALVSSKFLRKELMVSFVKDGLLYSIRRQILDSN